MSNRTFAQLRNDSRRLGERRATRDASTLRNPGNEPIDVTVLNLSVSGFAVECARALPIGARVSLGLPGNGTHPAWVVRREGATYGCEFFEPIPGALVSSAFAESTVATMPLRLEDMVGDIDAEPAVAKWPRPVRGWVLVGGAVAAWSAIAWLALR